MHASLQKAKFAHGCSYPVVMKALLRSMAAGEYTELHRVESSLNVDGLDCKLWPS